MNSNESNNKRQFEAGKRFRFPQMKDEVFMLVEERQCEYVARLDSGRWVLFATIDVVTETAVYLNQAATDPKVMVFDSMVFLP
jgi:hypothetical protein